MTRWLLRIFSMIALAGFSAAVWFAGPLIRFADSRPLGPVWLRATIIGVIVAAVALFYGLRFWRMRKAQKALETAVARNDDRDDDSQVLEARMNEAIAALKRSSGSATSSMRFLGTSSSARPVRARRRHWSIRA